MRVLQNQQMLIGEVDVSNVRFNLKSRDDIRHPAYWHRCHLGPKLGYIF